MGSSTPTATSGKAMCRSSCCSTSAATSTTGTRPSSTRSLASGEWSRSTTSASRATTGATPSTVEAMAHGAIAFVEALGLKRVDLLGFSIGSFVAQEIALIRPDLLRRIVLASAAPKGAAGMHGWAPQVIEAVGAPKTSPEGYLSVFFSPTATSLEAGQQAAARIFGEGRSIETSRRVGRPARPSTTRSAPGAFRTTRCSSG